MTTTWVDFIIDASPAAALALKISLLLAAAWAAHFALWRANPRWRVLLWRGVALGALALPAVALLGPALKVAVAPAPEEMDLANVVVPPVAALRARPVDVAEDLTAQDDAQRPGAPAPAAPWRIDWPLAGLAAWGVGVLLLGLRHGLGQRAMGRIVREAEPAPEAVQRIFNEIALELGVTQARLALSEAVRSPLLVGARRPVVLLPAAMRGEEFRGDLPAIFAHELNHAAARDLAWLSVVRLAQTLLWAHPLAWGICAACAAATERVTDAAAAEALNDSDRYSRSLARVALALAGRPVGQPALAMAIPDIRRRLMTLKQGRAARPLRRGLVRLALVGTVVLVAALGAFKPVAAESTPVKQEVVFLQYAVADDLAYDLVNRISPAGEKRELNLMLRAHHSLRLGETIINLRNLDAGKDDSTSDGSAELVVNGEDKAETFLLPPGQSRTVRDHEITVSSIGPLADLKEDALFLHVAFRTRPVPGKALAKPLEGITIDSFGGCNALIVRYTNPDSYNTLKAMIQKLDKTVPQIVLETMILDVKDPALDLAGELGAKMLDGQAGADKKHLAAAKVPGITFTKGNFDKIKALEAAGRLKRTNGPKVYSLDHQEAVFRIEEQEAGGKKADASVLRVVPVIDSINHIHLKPIQVDLIKNVETGTPVDVPGHPKGEFTLLPAESAGNKPAASRTFDLEMDNGQSVLLTAPEFGGRCLLITAVLVE